MARSQTFWDKHKLVILCTVVIIVSRCVDTHRLNVPRVLLPIFNDFPANFTLEVTEGGCYQWSTSRLDLIRLVPLNENIDRTCSSAVLVQTVTKESMRNTAIVLAEDTTSGQFLRCDVILDAIFSFNLVTTTRELFIDAAPEAFEVRAYDEQGNEFTTLAGVEFTWTIGNIDKHGLQKDTKLLNNVLRFMTFHESPYETPSTVAELDAVGRKGHITLLEGIRTGSAKVSVRSSHAEYRHVPAIEVELIVVANLIILPSDVTMMAYDSFNYKIMQVHQGHLEEIRLPSSQYYLEAENNDILEINNDHGSAYALGKGKTKVVLYDRNVAEEHGVVRPSATVNINEPAYITVTVLPHRNWGLILGHTHKIMVEIYDRKDRKFHVGEGIEVDVHIDSAYLNVHSRTQNGTHIVGIPIATGTTIIEASLIAIINNKGKRVNLTPQLTTRAELAIHSPVIITPKTLAVPWDPRSKPRFEVALSASGGDGTYMWTSQDPSIATVSQNGVVGILKKGFVKVVVSMVRNQHNRDETDVHALTPSRLEIIEYNMEAAVGEAIHIHLAMYGEMKKEGTDELHEIPFNDCQDIPLDVYILDGSFVRNNSERVEPIGIACTTLVVVGLKVGVSGVTVAYNNNRQYLMDNVTISAYQPLSIVHPSTGDTLLAVGSSRRVVFKGGPQPWMGEHQGYTRDMQISSLGVVRVAEQMYTYSETSDVYVYDVTCESLGDVTLTLKVSNTPVLPNCRRTDASASVRITCGKPRYIYLIPEFKDSENCPISQNTDRAVMERSGKDFELTVVVKDEDGKRFDNVTSLNIEWSLQPADCGTVEKISGVMEEPYEDMYMVLPYRHYQQVLPKQCAGTLQVNARVTGYQKRILAKLGIVPEWPPFATETERGTIETPLIGASINVMLVNDTLISPTKMKILNDPSAEYSMQVTQGSGFYKFILSSKDIAKVGYVEPTKTITVQPLSSGILQIALVDLCLPSSPAEAIIEVQQLGGIQVEAIDKVEIGKCISVVIRLFDTNGHTMEMPSIDSMNIKTYTNNGRIEVKRLSNNKQDDPPYERILYMVYGIEEGDSQLSFGSGRYEEEIRSDIITIQVFPPLRITPRNVTILVGTVYQLATIGGPLNSKIEFISGDNSSLDVSGDGLLEGKSFGATMVTAITAGITPNGERVVYSKDSVQVRIVPLEGIKITSPTTRIKVGATIPVWVFGIPDQLTPLVFGSMKNEMRFSWSTNNKSGVIKLANMYDGTGIDLVYDNEVTVRATGLRPGTATIYLNVTAPCYECEKPNKDTSFVTSLRIEIFEELHLIGVDDGYGRPVILMTPNSVFKLNTNRDQYGLTTYKILLNGNTSEINESNALTSTNRGVTVDKNGLVTAGDVLGKTVLSITSAEAYTLKQTLTLVIEVKEIHYIMLELKSKLRVKAGEELYSLPRGMELDYIVGYYDNVGSKFNAGQTKLSVSTNRADLALFSAGPENMLSVKFMQNGHIVAKIYDEKFPNGILDYVTMTVGDVLFPPKTTLTVGDVVCFSMPLLSVDGDSGYWQSSDSEILTVDSRSGIGTALTPGHVSVTYSSSALAYREIQLDIQPISEIIFNIPNGQNITGTKILGLPLILKNSEDSNKKNNILSRGESGCRMRENFEPNSYPFTCTVQFSDTGPSVDIKDLFLVKARFNLATGFYYCDVIPVVSQSKATSTLDVSLLIGAQSRNIETMPVLVPFLPSVYIPVKEIVFAVTPTSSMPSAIIHVYGISTVLSQLTIHLPNGLILISDPHVAYETVANFKVRMAQHHDELQGSQIRLVSKITKQDVPILVRISKYDQGAPIIGINWLDYAYYHRYTFGTFIVLLITFFYFVFLNGSEACDRMRFVELAHVQHKQAPLPNYKYTLVYGSKIISINISAKNKYIFAEKCPPPIKKAYTPSSPGSNVTSTPSPTAANTSLRPFSAFEPVYGDPRGFYTPNARRNRSLLTS